MKLTEKNSWPFLVSTTFFIFLLTVNIVNLLIRKGLNIDITEVAFAIIMLLVICLNMAALYERLWGYVALLFNLIVFLGMCFLLIALHTHEQGTMLYTMIGLTFLANGVYFNEMIFRKFKHTLDD